MSVEPVECAQCANQMMNWIRFNKRCSFMVMRGWIWMSSVQRYLQGRGRGRAMHSFPFSLSLFILIKHALTITTSLLLAFSLVSLPLPHYPSPSFLTVPLFLQLSPLTVLRALSMSMPWLQGTAGLARQSPALPRRETSTRCRRRYLKASAITKMASWVSAEVYCTKLQKYIQQKAQWNTK